ncbi:Essential recombination function protein [uncultured Caudovirales phage]|uniref:Essential recombination function protein n=1 Tax=uncultured Caudovirales phage TaxID=2100421 RepID=A0A6J7WJS5_9CAUD|nr:Essential recombination function protein [uncultured Caudovirales phage]
MKTLNESLLCFQSKSVAVHKNAKADRYKYADLPAVLEAVVEPLTDCGLVLRQRTEYDRTANVAVLVTSIVHVATGEKETQELPLFIDDKPQSFGSRLTYFRRYSILTILGLSPEDDDGLAAQTDARMEKHFDARPAGRDVPPQRTEGGGDLGRCRDCGAPNRMYKNGKPGCSKFCWKDRAPAPAQRAESDGYDNQYNSDY